MADCDVYVCFHDSDQDFVDFFSDCLEKEGLKVWRPKQSSQSSKGKALVDAKVCIVVLSPESLQDKTCEDSISLAYISDKPLFPIALKDFPELEKNLAFSMKLILAKLNWVFFIPDETSLSYPTDSLPMLVSSIKREIGEVGERQCEQPEEEEEEESQEGEEGGGRARWRMFYKRWNSLTEAAEAVDFWQAKFGSASEVSWIHFREAFTDVYLERIKAEMADDKVQWIMNILYGDVLELRKIITKKMYNDFAGDESLGPDRFLIRLMDYAKGTIAMRGVFDMKSTVRLDAVQSLGQFRTAPVIRSLISLLSDKDANMRAVAAIALGKTEVRSKRVVSKLIAKLTDEDRLVREATCLSLGHLKAKSSVPHLVEIWRSDLISDVRAAAEVALGQVGSEEAKNALQMTYLLSKEMSTLEAQDATM